VNRSCYILPRDPASGHAPNHLVMKTLATPKIDTRVNSILRLLADGYTAGDAARATGTTRQNIFQIAKRAEEDGRLQPVPDSRPRRWRPGPAAPDTSAENGGRDRVLHAWTAGRSEFGNWPPPS